MSTPSSRRFPSSSSSTSSSPPPSKFPSKSLPTIGVDKVRMDAKSYLTQFHSPSSSSTIVKDDAASISTRSSSLVSYSDSCTRPRSGSSTTSVSSSSDEQHNLHEARPAGWKGLNSPMPLPSTVSASRAPTRAFDTDFTPNPQDPYSLRHSEFGFDDNAEHRTESKHMVGMSLRASEEEPSIWIYLGTYLSYALLICIGHLRDFFGKLMFPGEYSHLLPNEGYAPLFSDFDSFYTRRLKLRIDDCFARPVTSVAARTATLLDRTSSNFNTTFSFTGETTQALNVSSYNYLGFAQSRGACADQAEETVRQFGISSAGSRADVGGNDLHVQAERLMAAFLGVEDCMIVATGFATNSTNLPALVTKGCLVISDELNHSSIRFGARLSGAMVRQYKHNDMDDLESLLRECVSQGQPRTHRPWKKILIVVEGLYSMEGTLVDLPRILELKDIYKVRFSLSTPQRYRANSPRHFYQFYLYVDEAHSIGALGPRGRGVCDYFGVDPRRVDILMGTFTKCSIVPYFPTISFTNFRDFPIAFGAAGGYVAGSHSLITALRLASHSDNYAEAMPPPIVSQIITSTGSIMGPSAFQYVPSLALLPSHLMDGRQGTERLRRLAFNCRYLNGGLKKLGFIVFGHRDSPIVPMLVYAPGKFGPFSRLMLERHKIIVVVVAYPATPLVSGRVRFCVSAAHTKADLDQLLRAVDDVGSILGLKLAPHGDRMDIEDVIKTGVGMVRDTEKELEL